MRKTATLSLFFEWGDLWVQTHINGLKDFADCERVLSFGPEIVIEENMLAIRWDGKSRLLGLADDICDACGKWKPGADKQTFEGIFKSQISDSEFMRLLAGDCSY